MSVFVSTTTFTTNAGMRCVNTEWWEGRKISRGSTLRQKEIVEVKGIPVSNGKREARKRVTTLRSKAAGILQFLLISHPATRNTEDWGWRRHCRTFWRRPSQTETHSSILRLFVISSLEEDSFNSTEKVVHPPPRSKQESSSSSLEILVLRFLLRKTLSVMPFLVSFITRHHAFHSLRSLPLFMVGSMIRRGGLVLHVVNALALLSIFEKPRQMEL